MTNDGQSDGCCILCVTEKVRKDRVTATDSNHEIFYCAQTGLL